MKSVDGRTAKGLRIRAEVKERIIAAYMGLMRDGVPTPTARQIALRAKLSVRVIFKHFADLTLLRSQAIGRLPILSRTFFAKPARRSMPPEEGLRDFVERQTRMFEEIAPFRRSASMIEYTDPYVAVVMRKVRNAAAKDIQAATGPALRRLPANERRELLVALHALCAWPSWELLRSHHGLSAAAARRVLTDAALDILRATMDKT
jgi:AcrR family transcriptional regulator